MTKKIMQYEGFSGNVNEKYNDYNPFTFKIPKGKYGDIHFTFFYVPKHGFNVVYKRKHKQKHSGWFNVDNPSFKQSKMSPEHNYYLIKAIQSFERENEISYNQRAILWCMKAICLFFNPCSVAGGIRYNSRQYYEFLSCNMGTGYLLKDTTETDKTVRLISDKVAENVEWWQRFFL